MAEKTRKFQEELQTQISEILGEKVSLDKAWQAFKGMIAVVVSTAIKAEDKKLSLSGVGKFYIVMSKPRQIQGQNSLLVKNLKEVPHLRWKPSERIKKFVIKSITGYDVDAGKAKVAPAVPKAAAPVAKAPAPAAAPVKK